MAYQKRQISTGTDLETAKYVAKAGDKDINARRTGQAIGAIGTEVGEAVGKALGQKKAKPNKTAPNNLAKLEQASQNASSKLASTVQTILPNSTASLPEILPNPPRPQPSITQPTATASNDNPYVFGQADQGWSQPRGDWQGPLTHPTGPVHHVDQGTLAEEQRPKASTAGSWYRPQHPGSGNINPAKSPFPRTVDPNAAAQTTGQAIGAIGSQLGGFSEGRPEGDYEQEKQALSYLGSAGRAATEAANQQIRRRNYKREVWDNKRKEADEQFSKLTVDPSGVTSYDASVQQMAMEWKKEAADLIRSKDQYDPYEYSQKLQEIEARAGQYNSASQNLQQVVADYAENIDSISASTPPETIDILDTLNKGGAGLSVQNVNGVPTLTGTTMGGQDVSVPISEIASGKNTFKFNNRIDAEPLLEGIVDDAFKFQSNRATQLGLVKTQLGFDQLRPRIESKVDGLLKNDYQVRQILADKFGYDFDDYEAMVTSGQDPKQFARQLLMEDIQDRMAPKFQADAQNFAAQQEFERGKIARAAAKEETPGTVTERKALEFKQYVADGPELDSDESVKYYGNALARKGARIRRNKKGEYFIVKGKTNLGPANKQSIESFLTGQAPSPVNRKGPLKRLTDWMGITK